MATYKTPNVYIEEVATIPPSVAPVATAVPAFIGHTEKAGNDQEYQNQPIRINSMLDYTTLFGGASPTTFAVNLDTQDKITAVSAETDLAEPPEYLMYYTLRLFFENGGGSCYIVSIGDYNTKPERAKFSDGLTAISKEDEPTLLLLTDAVHLAPTDYYTLCQEVLQQCNKLKDRFGIFDILASDRTTNGIGDAFRQAIGTSNLKYGATYYPYLQTALTHHYTDDSVSVDSGATVAEAEPSVGIYETGENGLRVIYSGPAADEPTVRITVTDRSAIAIEFDSGSQTHLIIRCPTANDTGRTFATAQDIVDVAANTADMGNFRLEALDSGEATIEAPVDPPVPLEFPSDGGSPAKISLGHDTVKLSKTELYNAIKTALNGVRVVMPPGGAVAGAYARVDRERGVWKAPANVSLASVIGPMVKITNEDQENLNVDPTSGKSINAIRSFTGKGTLIWGARTLAGNDNEWRYIPVRRLFNLIEESIQKATSFVVFEANNAITWLKVRTIIETYLEGLWRQGAMAGATQQQAYFVSVGLGQTMTEQDILEGRMIIEIGIAAVRPAEFIILRFSHKLQQS